MDRFRDMWCDAFYGWLTFIFRERSAYNYGSCSESTVC